VIRAVPLILLVILVLAVGAWASGWVKAAAARRPARRGSTRVGGYEFEGRIAGARRRRQAPPEAGEHDAAMEEFLHTHDGVEAFVEPETVVSPRSVVLVDASGEWRRFPFRGDAHLRRLAAANGMAIFDAARTGYPPRMRRRPGDGT
jgi:hypothetical protein